MQEVRIIHTLDNPNILRFYEWYETNHHLWLILELCSGGDLCSLIKSEGKFPESSIHDFGRDLLLALQYIHMAGIIHCDVKPSNILLDENGRIKLGGFSLSLRLQEINDRSFKQYPAERGSPSYMAPELFQEGATFSSASDLWALGCCLYECAVGHPPFVSDTLTDLVNQILCKEPRLPTQGFSEPFVDLLQRLLDKNPASRITWMELCQHPFWEFTLGNVQMPQEPALQAFIDRHNLKPKENRTQQDVLTCAANLRQSVDVSKLTKVVKCNIEKETEVKEYRAQKQTNPTKQHDVKLDPNNMDAELDFREPEQNQNDKDNYGEGEQGSSDTVGNVLSTVDLNTAGGVNAVGEQRVESPSLFSKYSEGSGHTPQKQQSVMSVTQARPTQNDSQKNIQDLIFHKSDWQIRPIVGNKRIEKLSDPKWNEKELPFKSLSTDQLHKQSKQSTLQYLEEIQRVLGTKYAINEKLNTLSYLESLCTDSELVNTIINSMLSKVMVRMLGSVKQQAGLRAKLAQVLGLMLRYATWITDDFMRSGILQALLEATKDHNSNVKRKSAAALGELLYYIASQTQESKGQISKEWEIPGNTISVLIKLLRSPEDECTQHYTVKAIENLVTQGGEWANKFATQELVNNLMSVFSSAKNEHLKATAASTCYRVFRYAPGLIQQAIQSFGIRLLLKSLKDSNARIQIAMINILNLALPDVSPRAKAGLMDEQSLVPSVIFLLGHQSSVLRAKAMITIALLCKQNTRFLMDFCNLKLMLLLQRLMSDTNTYIQDCLELLKQELQLLIPLICEQVNLELDQLTRRLYSSGGNNVRPSQRSQLMQIGVLSHLLLSTTFREIASSESVIKHLAEFIRITVQPGISFQGLQQFKAVLQDIVRSLNQQEILILRRVEIITYLVPQLCYIIKQESAAAQDQYQCAVVLTELMIQFLTFQQDDKVLEKSVTEHIIPLLQLLFDKGDHFILQAQKLLVGLLNNDSAWIKAISELDLCDQILDCLSLQNQNNNVHNLWICNQFIQHSVIDRKTVAEKQVTQKILDVLEYSCTHKVKPFIEPVLELCRILSEQEIESPEGLNRVFIKYFPHFLYLCNDQSLACQDLASYCVLNLTKLNPHESSRLLFMDNNFNLIHAMIQSKDNNEIVVVVKVSLLQSLSLCIKFNGLKVVHEKNMRKLHDLIESKCNSVDVQVHQALDELQSFLCSQV